jgi:lysophospholipase L1-like esterase
MRKILLAVTLALLLPTAGPAEDWGLRNGDVVLCFGDSITYYGAQPWGYVSAMRRLVAQRRPDWKVQFFSMGSSGAGASVASAMLKDYQALKAGTLGKPPGDLLQQLTAGIDAQPTVVIFMFGVNDATSGEATATGRRTGTRRWRRISKRLTISAP